MAAAPAGTFDKAAFVAAVRAAIAKQAPKNLDDADKFAKSGKSDAIASEVKGRATAGKDASAKPMDTASKKPPDTASAKEKPVVPLAGPPAVGAPATIDAASAMPAKAPAEQTDLRSGPAETDNQMAEAGVTEEQLANSNEPEFTGALKAKKEGEQHSATAPAEFRAAEAATLASARQGAQAAGAQTAAGLTAVRGPALQQSAGGQQAAQSKDEQNRAKVSSGIKSIFDATKTDVDAILNGLDGLVDQQFTKGEADAKAAFTAYHEAEMKRFKDRRYSGPLGWTRWTADLFLDLPPEANKIFVDAKAVYEKQMNAVIDRIADTIGGELNRAKERIAKGRKEIQTYVTGLDPALRNIGKEAAQQIGSQFDQLEESVNEKSQALAEDLAEKYVEAGKAIDEQIVALQEANKGLISKAKDAVGGAIQTILKLKDMLLGVLARAAGAVEKIIKDPIGFLGNFVNAVKTGVMNFGSNILEHLKKGLQAWLFGALAEAGVEIPEKFDLKGIVSLILSLLGLTWASIRARLAKVLPEWVLTAVEKAVAVVQILATEGVGGLWKWIVEKITDLKEQVMSQIKDFVITKIITAGITWLISLLNPAAAFIKACKMIYDAVMWFVDNAERLGDFVNSVLDSVESIAAGGVGKVAGLIEKTLAKALPMVISGLASLLGLGGISDKIKKILQTIQKPVGKVVDGIIKGVVKYGKKLLGKLKRKKKEKGGDGDKAKVKAEAEAYLSQRANGRVENPAQVKSAVSATYAKYRPKGLSAIEVKPTGPGKFNLDVVVSRAKIEMEEPQKLLEKDFKVGVGASGRATGVKHVALVAAWNGRSLPRQESDGPEHHAEDALIAYISANRQTLPQAPVGARNRLDVTLTKSPCPRCGIRLRKFMAAHSAELTIAMTGLYHGRTQTRQEKKRSLEALIKLTLRGAVLRVPELDEVLAQNGLQEIDPRSRAALAARLEKLRAQVKTVNERVDAMRKAGKR